jgi:phage terminase large subunit
MATLKLKGTNVLSRNLAATKRIVANQGGTGSGKTYALCQLIILLALQDSGQFFSIARKSLPTLKASAMKDFFKILRDSELYSHHDHNKTDHTYQLNGNTIEFFGLDDPQKVRSRRRDYLYLNEANEFTKEDFRQLSMRTNKRIYLDYNPSDQYHWLYDDVLTSPDCDVIRSTYLDNPFLPQEIIREIRSYKDKDQNYWRIYGLGERGISQTTIFTHWQLSDELPAGDVIYGLDFGFNHPAALIKVVIKDDNIYTQEKIYQSHLKTDELLDLVKANTTPNDPIYCDAEDPQAIKDLENAGLYALAATKGKNSVMAGIREIQKRAFYITKESANVLKEAKSYSWKEKDGKPIDEPVKARDHAMDAIRMAVFSHLGSNDRITEDDYFFA